MALSHLIQPIGKPLIPPLIHIGRRSGYPTFMGYPAMLMKERRKPSRHPWEFFPVEVERWVLDRHEFDDLAARSPELLVPENPRDLPPRLYLWLPCREVLVRPARVYDVLTPMIVCFERKPQGGVLQGPFAYDWQEKLLESTPKQALVEYRRCDRYRDGSLPDGRLYDAS